MHRIYLITEPHAAFSRTLDAVAAALSALPRGAAAVQLRRPGAVPAALLDQALELRAVCAARDAPLLVNDRADVARAAGAGVHLPSRGLPADEARRVLGEGPSLVAVSCHVAADVARAAREGADFCVLGPMGEVPGKGPAIAWGSFEAIAAGAPLPVFALGGIDASSAARALRAGARGVACIRAVLGQPDPAAAAAGLWRALHQGD